MALKLSLSNILLFTNDKDWKCFLPDRVIGAYF